MLPELQQLLVLQDRDQRIAVLGIDLERLPREEEEAKTRLTGDQKAVAAIELKIKENEVTIKGLELDIDTRKDTIAKLKVQQFETRKNEEYQALTHEVDRYGRDISDLEDRELEFMEIGETLKADLSAAQEALAKTQSVVDTELGIIAERRGQCEAQMEDTKQDRASLAAAVDSDLLDEFERIFLSKKGAAVVELEESICKGCHMKVTPATAGMARAAKQIAHCDQCGRMLYVG